MVCYFCWWSMLSMCRLLQCWQIAISMGDGLLQLSILSFTMSSVEMAAPCMELKDPFSTSEMLSTISTSYLSLLYFHQVCFFWTNANIAGCLWWSLQSSYGFHLCHCSHTRKKGGVYFLQVVFYFPYMLVVLYKVEACGLFSYLACWFPKLLDSYGL